MSLLAVDCHVPFVVCNTRQTSCREHLGVCRVALAHGKQGSSDSEVLLPFQNKGTLDTSEFHFCSKHQIVFLDGFSPFLKVTLLRPVMSGAESGTLLTRAHGLAQFIQYISKRSTF